MKKKILFGSIIVIVAIALISVSILKSKNTSSAFGGGGRIFNVTVENIEKGNISSYISANGSIEEIEKQEVYFETPLKVEKLLVEKNQKVVKGQKLVELELDSLTSELEKLKINKSIQELSLNATTLETEISRARSGVESAERAYEDSKKNYNNTKSLFEAKAVSKNDLDMAQKAVIEAETALKNARLGYDSAVTARNMDKKTKEENLKATNLGISEIEKKIQKIQESMYSNIDGVIADIGIQQGSFTNTMQPAFTIVNTEKLQVKSYVKEYDIKNVKVGQNVKITGDAIDKEMQIRGKVESISPVAKTNRTASGDEIVIETIISIENCNAVLKPGLSVTCDISTIDKNNIIVAPMEVVEEDKDGNKFVYVVNTDTNTMIKKQIKLGISSDMTFEVEEGLNEGDTVILNPQPIFKDGARVRISNTDKK